MLASELGGTCAICLQILSEAGCCKLQPCKHVFHEHCILGMRRYGSSDRCPLCREISKDLTTAEQLYEKGLMLFVRKSYKEAEHVFKEVIYEIDPNHEKSLELLATILSLKRKEEEASEMFDALRSEFPDRGGPSPEEVDRLASELGSILISLEKSLLSSLTADQPSKKVEALKEFQMLAGYITVTGMQTCKYSALKTSVARTLLIAATVEAAAIYLCESCSRADIKCDFFVAAMKLKWMLAKTQSKNPHFRTFSAAEAALARATVAVKVFGRAGLVPPGFVSQADQALRIYDPDIKLAFTAVIREMFGNGDSVEGSQSADINRGYGTNRVFDSCSVPQRGQDVDDLEDIVDFDDLEDIMEEKAAEDVSNGQTGLLEQLLYDKANVISSTSYREAEQMDILEVRRYQDFVTDHLMNDPDLRDCYHELPGGAKYFGPSDLYHPLIQALELHNKKITFKHVVAAASKTSKVCAVIKAIRSSEKVRISGKTKIKTCPTIIKNGFIHVELPSSMHSGARSLAFTAPPCL